MSSEPSTIDQAVARALRANLQGVQRQSEELHQAIADLVAACSSNRPANALPHLLRAEASAASLAAVLEVLAKFVAQSASTQPARRQEDRAAERATERAVAPSIAPLEIAPSIPAPSVSAPNTAAQETVPESAPAPEIVAPPTSAPAVAEPEIHAREIQAAAVEAAQRAFASEESIDQPPSQGTAAWELASSAPPPANAVEERESVPVAEQAPHAEIAQSQEFAAQPPEPHQPLPIEAFASSPSSAEAESIEPIDPDAVPGHNGHVAEGSIAEAMGFAATQPAPEASLEQSAVFDITALPADQQEMHRRANRVAKVSMQDIQLLRPAEVKKGRETKDICIRLKDEIEKARREYERRFRPILGHGADYFYHWMVEVLGAGDADALGEYPYHSPVLRH